MVIMDVHSEANGCIDAASALQLSPCLSQNIEIPKTIKKR
jgi:hypothetical protein